MNDGIVGVNQLERALSRADPDGTVYDQAHDTSRSYDEAARIVEKRAQR